MSIGFRWPVGCLFCGQTDQVEEFRVWRGNLSLKLAIKKDGGVVGGEATAGFYSSIFICQLLNALEGTHCVACYSGFSAAATAASSGLGQARFRRQITTSTP